MYFLRSYFIFYLSFIRQVITLRWYYLPLTLHFSHLPQTSLNVSSTVSSSLLPQTRRKVSSTVSSSRFGLVWPWVYILSDIFGKSDDDLEPHLRKWHGCNRTCEECEKEQGEGELHIAWPRIEMIMDAGCLRCCSSEGILFYREAQDRFRVCESFVMNSLLSQ